MTGLVEAICPNFEDHTPQPEAYMQWHSWADEMAKTHKQRQCPGCGLWTIWVPKSRAAAIRGEGL